MWFKYVDYAVLDIFGPWYNSSCTDLRALVDLLGVGAGRFEAGEHLQEVEQRGEVRLLEQQQHGDVLLLGGRQAGGRQLDALALPLPPRSAQRHEHHLGPNDKQETG